MRWLRNWWARRQRRAALQLQRHDEVWAPFMLKIHTKGKTVTEYHYRQDGVMRAAWLRMATTIPDGAWFRTVLYFKSHPEGYWEMIDNREYYRAKGRVRRVRE